MQFHVPLYKTFNAGDDDKINAFKRTLEHLEIPFVFREFTFKAFDYFYKVEYPLDRVQFIYSRHFSKDITIEG